MTLRPFSVSQPAAIPDEESSLARNLCDHCGSIYVGHVCGKCWVFPGSEYQKEGELGTSGPSTARLYASGRTANDPMLGSELLLQSNGKLDIAHRY